MVAGVKQGFPPETSRNTKVVIRNSIAHDMAGDGIVLFQVNDGLIENSVAWHTGMQDTESIGTPNAIWTWMCRKCLVRRNEAFLTDSPGVDGGAFDIDYGDDNNIVEENYGHDTQGYCVAVFGAGWATTNSVVRNNTCVSNGLSPREAHRQGAVFLTTWNKGSIAGLNISGNRMVWNPPLAAAAIVNDASITGRAVFEKNILQSASPILIRSNSSLRLDGNSYAYCGTGKTRWFYGGRVFNGFDEYKRNTGEDVRGSERSCKSDPAHPSRSVDGWCLMAFISTGENAMESRGQIALLVSVHRQFPNLHLKLIVAGSAAQDGLNLRYDWNVPDIPLTFDKGQRRRGLTVDGLPSLILIDPAGIVVWRHDGPAAPADLGLALRALAGNPQYAEMASDQ
jgi:hypothetical protein